MKIFDIIYKKQEREHSHSLPSTLQLAKKILFLPRIGQVETFTFTINLSTFHRVWCKHISTIVVVFNWFLFSQQFCHLNSKIKTLDPPKNTISLTARTVRLWCLYSFVVRLCKLLRIHF